MESCEPSEGMIPDESDFEGSWCSEDRDGDAMEIEPPVVRKLAYTVMNSSDIAEKQQQAMDYVQELLDVSREESYALLQNFGWDSGRLQEAWFDNEAKVRDVSGITLAATPATSTSPACPVCLADVEASAMHALRCGHAVCADCWRGYLHSQAEDGKAAIQAACPQHKCRLVVPKDFFRRFCDEERYQKYERWYVRSFVDDNPCLKWCPSTSGCGYAIEYQGVDPIEICCSCGCHFCWGCLEEAHRPAHCRTVAQWNLKNSAESENVSWIMANTKKCPKCHRAIEKNQGCNHMACSKSGGCGHQFCWLCLGDWATHGSGTGGYYQCNLYEKQAKEGKHADEERSRQKAKHALDKYMFYFERFMNHDKAMKFAVKERRGVDQKVQTLHDKHGFEIMELQFLYDALEQVTQSRRVLKWSYVYGYYLDKASADKNLFEHLQKNLEEKTDYLHEMIEKDLDAIFHQDMESTGNAKDKFMEFRSHVTNFTNVTQKFRTQILTDLGATGSLTSL